MISPQALLEALRRALPSDRPVLVVIAGSNGAGKSTFYDLYLRALGLPFVNADDIARALRPETPAHFSYAGAVIAEAARRELVTQRASFCMETVFSDPGGQKLQFLRAARASGYCVVFLWIRLSDAQLSAARVSQRVARGGHDVPQDKLAARFERTRRNAAEALGFVDIAAVIDNSSVDAPYRLEEWWEGGRRLG